MRATIAVWSGKKLDPGIYPEDVRRLPVSIVPADTDTVQYARGTLMGRVDASGLYSAYNPTGTDGTQNPTGFLEYDISVNTDGMLALTTTPGAAGEVGERMADTTVIIGGYLFGADLLQSGDTGVLDTAAEDKLRGRWINGDLTNGIFKF